MKHIEKVLKIYRQAGGTIAAFAYDNPNLVDFLAALNIPIQIVDWNGKPDTLPTNELVVVETSRFMDVPAVAKQCHQQWHLVCDHGEYVENDGTIDTTHSLLAIALYFLINKKIIPKKTISV